MSLRHALLGFLGTRPLAGYDLKSLLSETGFLPWSGNNNQVYRTLVELHQEGLVSLEVQVQDKLPSRKVYALTDAGRTELRRWLTSAPEPVEVRSTFLVQLAWADLLSEEDLRSLLSRYEEEVRAQLDISREQARRAFGSPRRTPRETRLWDLVFDNRVRTWATELAWVQDVRKEMAP